MECTANGTRLSRLEGTHGMGKSELMLIAVDLPCQRLLVRVFFYTTAWIKSDRRCRVAFRSPHDGEVPSLSKVCCRKFQVSEGTK